MARPKVWTGSAWKDASFWTGSKWKTYSDDVYGSPASQYLFGSNNQSWTYNQPNIATGPASWTGGYIYGRTTGGLLSSVYLDAPDVDRYQVGASVTSVRFKYNWQTVKVGASATEITVYWDKPTLYGGTSEQKEYTSQAQSGTYTTGAFTVPADKLIASKPSIAVNDALLGSGNQTEIRCLQVELIDQAGNLVYKKTADGWEPLVWNGTKWI